MLRTLFLPLALVLGLSVQGCMFVNIPLTFPPADYQEVLIQDGSRREKILLLDIDGFLTSGARREAPLVGLRDSTVNEVADRLAKARDDQSIKAVVLRINSPGGGVTASDLLHNEIRRYQMDTGVPVYASLLDMGTSGAYYVAASADQIYVHPTTVTGSIGVVSMFPQFENLGHKIGVYVEVLKSGDNKDITGGFRNMTDEQREILQGMIDSLYERFLMAVMSGRPNLDSDTLRDIADGRIYTAEQSVDIGLTDGVKYLKDVLDLVRDETGAPDARVVMYRRTAERSYDSVYAESDTRGLPQPARAGASASGNTINLFNVDLRSLWPDDSPVFYYVWLP